MISKLPEKYDSYDALMLKNLTIERELPLAPGGWSSYKPQQIINKYRYPANDEEWDRYPNVDWQKALFRNQAMSYNLSANVSGGVKFVKYFTAVDFVYEGDLFRRYDNHRGYESVMDIIVSMCVAIWILILPKLLNFLLICLDQMVYKHYRGVLVVRMPLIGLRLIVAHRMLCDPFILTVCGDGMLREMPMFQILCIIWLPGDEKRTTTQITTDFSVNQQLDMITKGLQLKANLSMDNTFRETNEALMICIIMPNECGLIRNR